MHPGGAPSTRTDGSFSVSSRRLEEGVLVTPSGDLDLASAPLLEAELRRAEETDSVIVLDLGDVSFMDSTGLRTVIFADQRLSARGGALRIAHVPPQVRRLFELTGLSGRLTIDD